MRLVLQRVMEASVRVDGKIVGQIKQGALVLFGVHKSDAPHHTLWMAQKLAALRFFSDAQGKMNLSLQDIDGEVLIVSQFTLMEIVTKDGGPALTPLLQEASPRCSMKNSLRK